MAQFIRISSKYGTDTINIAHIVQVRTEGDENSYVRLSNGNMVPIDEDEGQQINIVLQDMGADSGQTIYDIDGTKRAERLEKKRREEQEDRANEIDEEMERQLEIERVQALRVQAIRERQARIKPIYDKMTEQQRQLFKSMNEWEQDAYLKMLKQHNIDLAKVNLGIGGIGNAAP